jgi:ADP-ribose pyrophosphatase YjhB (NUDIX family)
MIEHHIQKYILSTLTYQQYARFRDLRPPKTDTNLFSYHLKLLLKAGFITKEMDGYTLAQKGLTYVDRVSMEKFIVRSQPKIITMCLLTDSKNKIILQKRTKQPHINTWSLPHGKLHIEDRTMLEAAQREVREKLNIESPRMQYEGTAYIRIEQQEKVESSTITHIFSGSLKNFCISDTIKSFDIGEIDKLSLSPAIKTIISEVKTSKLPFFIELSV